MTAVPVLAGAIIACQIGSVSGTSSPPWRDFSSWSQAGYIVFGLVALFAMIFIFVPDASPLRVSNKHALSAFLACLTVLAHYALVWDKTLETQTWYKGTKVGLLVAGTSGLLFLFLNNFFYNLLLRRWLQQIVESHPVEAIAYALKEVLNGLEEDARPKTVEGLVETALDLDLAAAAFERGLCSRFKLDDPRRSASLKSDCAGMAGTLYKIQRLVLFPDSSTVDYVRATAGTALIGVLSDNWQEFPRERDLQKKPPAPEREWIDYLRLAITAVLPAAGVILLYTLPAAVLSPDSELKKAQAWVYAIAGLWFVFTALRALDPNLSATLGSFGALLGGLSQVKSGKGKENG